MINSPKKKVKIRDKEQSNPLNTEKSLNEVYLTVKTTIFQ